MLGYKRGDQEKPRRTPSGREKGYYVLNINLVIMTLTTSLVFLRCHFLR